MSDFGMWWLQRPERIRLPRSRGSFVTLLVSVLYCSGCDSGASEQAVLGAHVSNVSEPQTDLRAVEVSSRQNMIVADSSTTSAIDWAAIGRRPLDVSTAVAWRRAAANDTALAQPVSLALDSTQLYVSDPAAVRISALDRSTGVTNWHYGRRGGGPGELVGLAILNRADSGTWVLDNSARRAFRLSPSGEAVQFLGMRTAGNIRRFCQVDARTFAVVIMTGAALFELVIVNDSGTVLSKHRSAFTDLASGPYLAAQGRLMNLRAAGCLLGHSYADRVALVRSSGFADTFRFVERFDNAVAILEGPDGARQQRLASGATIGVVGIAEYSDMLLFAFGGKSQHKERLIDAYDSRTYEYRGSLLWHERIVDLAGDSNGLFILSGDADGLPAITALKLTPKRP